MSAFGSDLQLYTITPAVFQHPEHNIVDYIKWRFMPGTCLSARMHWSSV